MGVYYGPGGGSKDISGEVPAGMRADFNYFYQHLYDGDHDDFAEVVLRKFYAWHNAGAIRRQAPKKEWKYRMFVDVPFLKKDSFKSKYHGKWDPARKCWFVLVSATSHYEIREHMVSDGYKPILIMPENQDRVDIVFDSGLAKSKFNDLHNGHAVVGHTDKIYTG